MIIKIKNKEQAETIINFMNILRDNNIVARNNGYLIVDLNDGYCCNVTNEDQKERFLRCNPQEKEISFEQFVQDGILKMYKEKQKLIYELLAEQIK
jgi:hypothetical protein